MKTNTLSSGKEKVKKLNQEVTKLKQKTSLDSRRRSVDEKREGFKKLRDTAVKGTYDDKLDYFKTLVPDDYLQAS